MSDKAEQLAKLYKRIDNAQKLIEDLEMDIEEMLQAVDKIRSEIIEGL